MKLKKKIETALLYVSSRFITHITETSWGYSIWIMEKKGNGFARAYYYSDDQSTIYLDNLSVSWHSRKRGIGTKLQEIREHIGRFAGFKKSCLWVVSGTWQEEWYKRRGYVEVCEHPDETNGLWMEKNLIGGVELKTALVQKIRQN